MSPKKVAKVKEAAARSCQLREFRRKVFNKKNGDDEISRLTI